MAGSGIISAQFGAVDDHITHLQNTVQAMEDNHKVVSSVVEQLISGGYTGTSSDALGTSTQELKRALDNHSANLTALKAATATVAGTGGTFQTQDIASSKLFAV